MDALPCHWAEPLAAAGCVELGTRVTRIERDALDAGRWQLQTSGPQDSVHVYSGFDAVVLAIPHARAAALLNQSASVPGMAKDMEHVEVAPCWTLMLAYPQAQQPTLSHLGPQWNAALSTHHRIAWLARESSKPGRGGIERWTVQASAAWSQEHLNDDGPRVQAKLLKAFSEVTGIYAEPEQIDDAVRNAEAHAAEDAALRLGPQERARAGRARRHGDVHRASGHAADDGSWRAGAASRRPREARSVDAHPRRNRAPPA